MSRLVKIGSFYSFLAVLVLASRVSAVPIADEKDKAPSNAEVRAKLAKVISVPGFEANTPLKEAIAFLEEKFDLTILIDTDGFVAEAQIMEPENQPVKLPKMNKVRLETALRLVLAQGQGDFYVRDGIIWVVPKHGLTERLMAQTITISFDKKPLAEAIQELTEKSGLSVVLDVRRAGDKGKVPVTADLRNVTLEAAVMILADLAELKALPIDKAIYITTRENARELRIEIERKRDEESKRKQMEEGGPGMGLGGVAPKGA